MADERFERLGGVVDIDALRQRRVVVAGLGSGGSTVALELAKAGVGRFLLIDPDRLEERNLIRHECDDRYLGWNKAEAVADLIWHRNPEAEVETLAVDVFELREGLQRAVGEAALVAACTDAEPPKHLLNRLCTEAGVPAVYAGVYERGVGGEVIRCPGRPDDACYACATSLLKDSAPPPEDDEELDYGAIAPDGTLHGAPGLGLDVRLIALIHAKLCLLELLGESVGGEGGRTADPNVVLFGTAPVEGLFPRRFASAMLSVTRQDGCLVCGPMRHESGRLISRGPRRVRGDWARRPCPEPDGG
jgi:molybdopterin/thiamine biosynthesis adenylyltransferase